MDILKITLLIFLTNQRYMLKQYITHIKTYFPINYILTIIIRDKVIVSRGRKDVFNESISLSCCCSAC